MLIRQRLSAFFAIGDHDGAFEAEPVDYANREKDDQRELKDWDLAENIQNRFAGPAGIDNIQSRIGVGIAQTSEPEEIDQHQTAINQRQYIDQNTPAAQAERRLYAWPALETCTNRGNVIQEV